GSVGRRREQLARGQQGECPRRRAGPHADLEPTSDAGEHIGAKIQRGGEHAIGDKHLGVGQSCAPRAAAGLTGKKRELQVVAPLSRSAALQQTALIAERAAHRRGGASADEGLTKAAHRQKRRGKQWALHTPGRVEWSAHKLTVCLVSATLK